MSPRTMIRELRAQADELKEIIAAIPEDKQRARMLARRQRRDCLYMIKILKAENESQ